MRQKKSSVLFMAVIFFWFAQYVYIPFQTPYLTSVKTGADFIGIIVGAYGISQMALRLPVGVFADSSNRHKLFIMIGGAASAVASLCRVVFPNGIGFLMGNLFSGLASAMWISYMVLYMSFFDGAQQQKATSQIVLANNLGILAAFVTSTLLYDLVGMRVICVFSVISGIICMVLASMLPKGEEKINAPKAGELLKVCTQRRLLIFALLALVQQGVQLSTTMSFTTQIIKDLGADTLTVGMASIIYMVSAVFWAKFASKDICTRIGAQVWIPLVFIINMIYCVAVPNSGSILLICCLQILPGMSTGILFSYLTSEAMQGIPAEKKSTAMGFYQAVYALGMTVFPVVCGKILKAYSMKMAYYLLAGTCVAAALGAWVYQRKEH